MELHQDRENSASAPKASGPTGGGLRTSWRSLQWWPTLVAIAFTAFVASDLIRASESGADLAAVLAASGLVYLAAAALQKPASAWPVFIISVVVITAGRVGLIGFDPTWALIALAGLFLGYGLVRGATNPAGGLPLQTIAMLGFGGMAAAALYVNEAVGAYLVAAGLLGHAAWDVYHHRNNKVVVRSLAEFCFVLDTLLALTIVIVTLRG
jgi:hypothetical protein